MEIGMKDKIAIFCSGDENYLPNMVSALLIACKYNVNFDPWVITDASDDSISKFEGMGINFIKKDLKDQIGGHINDCWPSHSFWWYVGPKVLHGEGYKYSIFIDADVYCTQEIDTSVFDDDLEIAAVASDGKIKFNSGVILFNNEKMVNMDLEEKFMKSYNKMSTPEYVRWHGGKVHDQQVLCAMGKNNNYSVFLGYDGEFNLKNLDMTWNYRFNSMSDYKDFDRFIQKDYDTLKKEVKFVHFLLSRPWLPYNKWGGTHGLFRSDQFLDFNFPLGYVVKTRQEEPYPETRIRFVQDWRNELREIEDTYGVELFEEFDSLRSLLWKK
jgi:lipopolysaccharide biosynthesis glycosyltransferase